MKKDVPLMESMYLVFTCMPGESSCKQLGSLLFLWDVFSAPVNSLVCCYSKDCQWCSLLLKALFHTGSLAWSTGDAGKE